MTHTTAAAAAAAAAAKSLQSCPALCDPIDGSPPGSPVPGIFQARILEFVAISYSQDLLLRKYKSMCVEGEMTGIINFMNREYLCSGGFFYIRILSCPSAPVHHCPQVGNSHGNQKESAQLTPSPGEENGGFQDPQHQQALFRGPLMAAQSPQRDQTEN